MELSPNLYKLIFKSARSLANVRHDHRGCDRLFNEMCMMNGVNIRLPIAAICAMNESRQSLLLKSADISLAYLLLRIVVGVNYFNHGFTRLDNIPGFANSMVDAMEGAWMPDFLVRLTAYFVSPIELVAGLLLVVGLFTRLSLVVTFVLMVILMYGVTVVQNWNAASSQLIYNIVLFILLAGLGYNRFSLDTLVANRKRNSR